MRPSDMDESRLLAELKRRRKAAALRCADVFTEELRAAGVPADVYVKRMGGPHFKFSINDGAGEEVGLFIASQPKEGSYPILVSTDGEREDAISGEAAFRRMVKGYLSGPNVVATIKGEMDMSRVIAYENGNPVTKADLARRRMAL